MVTEAALRMWNVASGSNAARSLTLLSPLAGVVVVSASFVPVLTEWEELDPQLMRKLRVAHAALAAAACLIGAAPLTGGGQAPLMGRNALLLLGVTLLSAVVFEPQLSWIVPLGGTGVCYFFGQGDGPGSNPASWAILLRPSSTRMDVTSVAVYAAGVLAFSVRGPRRSLTADEI